MVTTIPIQSQREEKLVTTIQIQSQRVERLVTTIPIQNQRKRDWPQLYQYRVRGKRDSS